MPEKYHGKRKLNHREEVLRMVLIADRNPTKVVEPGEQPLDFPTSTVAAQRPKGLCVAAIAPVRGDHLDAQLLQEVLIQTVAVISLVPDQPLRKVLEKSTLKSVLDKSYLAPRSTFDACGSPPTRPASIYVYGISLKLGLTQHYIYLLGLYGGCLITHEVRRVHRRKVWLCDPFNRFASLCTVWPSLWRSPR